MLQAEKKPRPEWIKSTSNCGMVFEWITKSNEIGKHQCPSNNLRERAIMKTQSRNNFTNGFSVFLLLPFLLSWKRFQFNRLQTIHI